MIRRTMVMLLVFAMCLCCAGCIEPVDKEPDYEPIAEADSQLSIANPVEQMSREELAEASGIDLAKPEAAEEIVYSLITLSDNNPIAQMNFTLDGHELCLRAQSMTGEIAQDISGMYYNWETTEHVFVSRNYAVVYLCSDVGYIKWLDGQQGIQYSLSMTKGAGRDILIELAEAVFQPSQD